MPDGATLLAFTLAAAALVAIPGPNLIFIATRSAAEGRRAGVVSSLGVETGTFIHIVAAAAGLSALLASSEVAFAVVKYAGAAYLVFLGVRALRSHRTQDAVTPAPPRGNAYRQGVLVQLLNPKVAVFFLALLPPFVDPDRAAAPQILVLGLILSALGMTMNLIAALAAARFGRRVSGRASGIVYLGLGAYAGTR